MRGLSLLVLLAICASVGAKVYLEEKFGDGWDARWKQSDWKKDEGAAGEWKHTAGKWFGDEEADKGIQTHPDARFYNLYAEIDTFNNEGKDLVVQYSVKHEQKIDCGGGYIKLIPASSEDQMDSFSGDTPYSIMFGPDICGFSTKRVHVILTYKGKNYLTKKNIDCKTDELTHVYTLVIKPDNTYQVYIDLEEKASGSLYEDWDMIPPRKIKDPEAKKPEDWDEREKIADPEDKKPEGYDDIPEFITDPKATKPENWDDEEDGEWEAPQIPNPEYKGPWKPRMIDNPDYKGKWVAPEIDNPDFAEDDTLYQTGDLKYLGFELWQVKAGTIFDNIIVTDSFDEAKEFAESTWGKTKDAEMEMFNKAKEAEREKAEAEAAAKAETAKEDDEYDVAADEDAEDAADDVKDEL